MSNGQNRIAVQILYHDVDQQRLTTPPPTWREIERARSSINLRCYDIADAGESWIIRCRKCGAGWLPLKGNECPAAMIEHATTHQKRTSQIDKLRRQLVAVDVAIDAVAADLKATLTASREKLLAETMVYTGWRNSLELELEQLVNVKQPATTRN